MSQTQSKPEALEQVHEGMPGEPGKLIVFDLRRLARWSEERPDVQILSDIGPARLVLFAFKAGQQLQEHRTSSQILVQALRGRVIFTAACSSVKLHAGMADIWREGRRGGKIRESQKGEEEDGMVSKR